MQVRVITWRDVQGPEVGQVETEHTNWSAASQARLPSASASRAGWRRKPWGLRDFTSSARNSPMRGSRMCATSSRAARRSISPASAHPARIIPVLALVEVTQAHGPRLIVNNEEERFSGNKHTTEYPKLSIDAAVATLRGDGPRCRRYRCLAHELGLSDARRHAGALGDRGTAAEFQARAHHGGRRLRRPPPRPDDADAKNPRPPARACRARAADLPAASRQPRLVFLRRLAVRR